MKIIGSLFIVVSSIIATFFYEKRQRGQIFGLKEITQFIQYVRNQIEFFTLPLNEIYERYNPKGNLILRLINGESICFFNQKIDYEINSTFSSLGKGFKAEQLKGLDYLNNYLEKEIKEMEASYSQKIKVFRAMALFVGCCAIILFV